MKPKMSNTTDNSPLGLAKQAMIEIPKDKLPDLVKAVYAISIPVGMGLMQYQPGPISEETLADILNHRSGIYMDYVHGRQCKFRVKEVQGHYFISKHWPDHTSADLQQVLKEIGVTIDSDNTVKTEL